MINTTPHHKPFEAAIDNYARERIEYRLRGLRAQFRLSRQAVEDLRQDMAAELVKGLSRFDPTLGVKRETFINRVLDKHVLHAKRTLCTRMQRPWDTAIGFDDIAPGFEPIVNDARSGQPSERDLCDLRMDIAEITERLPDELRRLVQLRREHSPKEAREAIGASSSTFYRRMAEVRAYFGDYEDDAFFNDSRDGSASAAEVEGAQPHNGAPR